VDAFDNGPMSVDHFGAVAAQYARSRPTYPASLFDWLADASPGCQLAWDVGTGNGQAAVALAAHFERVLATDLSEAQLAEAPPHPSIAYHAAPAHLSGLPEHSAELVSVAQALHWFDLDAFYREVRRVLRPRGVIAAWTYGILHVEGEAVEACVSHFYRHVVGPYWPAERRHVESGYRELPFPFAPIACPEFEIRRAWTLGELLGYCRSWSAIARCRAATGCDPVVALEAELRPLWGDKEHCLRQVTWPISMLAGRIAATPTAR